MSEVAERLSEVRQRIDAACAKAGRTKGSVELVAVSKRQPASAIRAAYLAGQRAFAENYAQELRDKAQELADLTDLQWHAIGPLQINKVKYVAKVAHAYHALDRLETAAELSKRRSGPSLRCYLEVNVGAESSKSGVSPMALDVLNTAVAALPSLTVVGLMCLPPLSEDPEAARPHFRRLAQLARSLSLEGLSMGTTSDFEVAIDEGASLVRVGTAIFGSRPA
jgi:PLP dependent protein